MRLHQAAAQLAMWINKEVDLPQALVSAHRARRLVIFAGAGISMGAPSNLPDFGRLADLISGGTLTRTPDEPLDLFLGKLQSNAGRCSGSGQNVHRRSRINRLAHSRRVGGSVRVSRRGILPKRIEE